jgi:hypothetical protein
MIHILFFNFICAAPKGDDIGDAQAYFDHSSPSLIIYWLQLTHFDSMNHHDVNL